MDTLYLIFTCTLYEGFFQRFETLFKIYGIYMNLKNAYKVVIIFSNVSSQHFVTNKTFLDFFDFNQIDVEFWSINQYIQKFGYNLDSIVDLCVSDFSLTEILTYFNTDLINYTNYFPISLSPKPNNLLHLYHKPHPLLKEELLINNLQWEKKSFECINSYQDLIYLIKKCGKTLLIHHAENLQIPIDLTKPHIKNILLKIKFKNYLIDYANNYISKTFNDKNYLALHLRLGDYKIQHNYNLEHILNNIGINIQKNCNYKLCFIATNANNLEKKKIKEYIKQFNISVFYYNNKNLDDCDKMLIEQLICIKSNVFIADKKSLYSKFIIHRRSDPSFYNSYISI